MRPLGGAFADIAHTLPEAAPGLVQVLGADAVALLVDEVAASGEAKTNYVYRPAGSKVGHIVHVMVPSSTKDGDIVRSFIENFRPCRANGPSSELHETLH